MVAHAQPPDPDEKGEGHKPKPKAPATSVEIVTTRGKAGRPRQEFDLDHVRTLGSYAASYQEIASALRTTKQTIINRLEERGEFFIAYQEGLSTTKLKLRHRQIQLAMEGDCKMLTWLGMQLLQQRNKTHESHEIKSGGRKMVFTIQQTPEEGNDEEQVLENSTRPGVVQPIETTSSDERN